MRGIMLFPNAFERERGFRLYFEPLQLEILMYAFSFSHYQTDECFFRAFYWASCNVNYHYLNLVIRGCLKS